MPVIKRSLDRFFRRFSFGHPLRMLFYGMLVGLLSGLGAVAFFYLLEATQHLLFGVLCQAPVSVPRGEQVFAPTTGGSTVRWLFFALPAVGGLLAGLIVFKWAPEAAGGGTDAMIRAFHDDRGNVRSRVPALKALASILTLGTGGSVGREGPISQIGAGIGAWLANRLHLGVRKRRILLLAGAAGGMGAIFRAPLGAALSAVQVLYREDLESEALLPSVISSVTAYTVFSGVFGYDRIFDIPHVSMAQASELPFYLILALVCIPAGILHVRFFHAVRRRFDSMKRVPAWARPMLGGLLVGILGLAIPEVYGTSWGVMQEALFGSVALQTMLFLAVAKVLATAFSLGSGGSGGVFGPTLLIGGMLGGAVGQLGQMIAPGIVLEPHAYIMVGMAAFFAGVANAPLGVLLMVCEITGGYNLIAPLLLVSVVAIMFSRGYTIFPSQVEDRFHSPAHLGDVTFNILENVAVHDCFHRQTVPAFPMQMRFQDLPEWVRDPDVHILLVTDSKGKAIGYVPGDAVRSVPETGHMGQLLILYDVMETLHVVKVQDDLFTALGQLRRFQQKVLPVVDEDRFVGCVLADDIMDAYANEVFSKAHVDDE